MRHTPSTDPVVDHSFQPGSFGWVVVVDDEPQIRFLVVRQLQLAGYFAVEAATVEEAVDMCAVLDVDLVVLDLILPDHELTWSLERLRRCDPGLRVLAMTGGGRGGPGDLLRAAERLGARGVLAKPFSNADLLRAVENVLRPVAEERKCI